MAAPQPKVAKKIKSQKKTTSGKSSTSEKPAREREDKTRNLQPNSRGLDTLTKLLAGYSECIAVASIEGELCIAANEFNQGTQTKKNKSYQSIVKIISLLSKMTRNTANVGTAASVTSMESSSSSTYSNDRQEILQEICSGIKHFKIESTELSGFELLSESKKMILRIMQGEDPQVSMLLKEYGKYGVTAVSVWGTCRKLYREFLKMEENIKMVSENSQTTSEILSSLQRSNILLIEPQKVHAEVQILSHIVKMINEKKINQEKAQRIYLGISKLCCLHCRVMIEKANEIFIKRGIKVTIDVRGKHDLSFDKNWKSPQIFSKGYDALVGAVISAEVATLSVESRDLKEPSDSSLEYAIGLESFKCIRYLMLSTSQPSKAFMYGSQSDTEPEVFLEEMVNEKIKFLSELQKFQNNKEFIMQNLLHVISIAIELHKIRAFTEILLYPKNKVLEKPISVEKFHAIYAELEELSNISMKSSASASSSILLNITKDGVLSILADSLLCGAIAKHFKTLTPYGSC